MTFKMDLVRVEQGSSIQENSVRIEVTTAAQVNAALAKYPDHVSVLVRGATEAQLRGLLQHAQVITLAKDTSSVETAVASLF